MLMNGTGQTRSAECLPILSEFAVEITGNVDFADEDFMKGTVAGCTNKPCIAGVAEKSDCCSKLDSWANTLSPYVTT